MTTTTAPPPIAPTPDVSDPVDGHSHRSTVAMLVAAGGGFVLFPALRPWTDETLPTAQLAESFASDRWIWAHLSGILAIGLVAAALFGLRRTLAATPGAQAASWAAATGWSGAVLCALYFGAEIFGIHTIAARAVATGDPDRSDFLDAVTELREQSIAITMFGLGLVLVAVAGVLTLVALRRAGVASWWAALPFTTGLVLLLPQFWGSPAIRVGHGVLLGAGCLALASTIPRRRHRATPPRSTTHR